MPLSKGTRLGPYEIVEPIGAGGMGEVYRAHDPRMGRDVAIKVNDERFSDRFSREVHAVAALNHSNICQVHDVGANYLVMELCEGETLASRLKRGRLSIAETLRYGAQIADALAAAHAKGIVHRDLKPANVMLTKTGVKVLDFGLAKTARPVTSGDVTQALTATGAIVGTVQYMSPEQVQGKETDARSDIFSFGLVMYEMITGKRVFDGANPASIIAAILEREVPSLEPEGLNRVVRACLAKDPADRFQSARDLKRNLEWSASGEGPMAVVEGPRRQRLAWSVAAIALASLAGVALYFLYFEGKTLGTDTVNFTITAPFQADIVDVAVSPDGRSIAFVGGRGPIGVSELWLRPLDSFIAQKLPGTEGATRPFWSSDGSSIRFHYGDRLMTVDVGGRQNPVHAVGARMSPFASPTSQDGNILYPLELTGTGLHRISVSGGAPLPVTSLNAAHQEITHRYPQFLPDGRHFIYWVWSAKEEYTGIYAGSLDPTEKLPEGPLVKTTREARYVEPGYLIYSQGSRLVAQRFDASQFRLSGEPQFLPGLAGFDSAFTGRALLAVSTSRLLAYQEQVPPQGVRIVWRDRTGNQLRAIAAPTGAASTYELSLSPDEKRAAVTVDDANTFEDIWVVDLERATFMRLTSTHGSSCDGLWAPDGRNLVFRSNRNAHYDLFRKDADGSGEETLVLKSTHYKIPTDWSADGRFLVYQETDPKTFGDIWVLPQDGGRKPFPFLNTEFHEFGGKLSRAPDAQGHLWMAYASNETGRAEVYIRQFLPGVSGAAAGPRLRISTGGGFFPHWRKDGRELFYISVKDGKRVLMAADIKLGGTPEVGTPKELFALSPDTTRLAPFADGRRFLLLEPEGDHPTPKINVVLNWTANLSKSPLKAALTNSR